MSPVAIVSDFRDLIDAVSIGTAAGSNSPCRRALARALRRAQVVPSLSRDGGPNAPLPLAWLTRYHCLGELLLRRGLHYAGRNWTRGHRQWIDNLIWTHTAERAVVDDYPLAIEHTESRLIELDAQLAKPAPKIAVAIGRELAGRNPGAGEQAIRNRAAGAVALLVWALPRSA